MHAMELGLGTAAFGISGYGISNATGFVSSEVLQDIMRTAAEFNLNYIDTANAYGPAEMRLGNLIDGDPKSFKIVTKISAFSMTESYDEFKTSLANLRRKNVYGLLLHALPKYGMARFLILFNELIEFGLIKKAGISIYNIDDLHFTMKHNFADIIQVPVNIFDQRFLQVSSLLQPSVEIHCRSAFLQGALFLTPAELMAKGLPGLIPKIKLMDDVANSLGITRQHLAVEFLKRHAPGPVILGATSAKELRETVSLFRSPLLTAEIDFSMFAVSDESLIDPRSWRV